MMSTSSRGHGREPIAEINVTPLVDVVLVLLIIFMVTAPMIQRGVDVNLPVVKQANTIEGETLIASNTEAKTSLGSHGFIASLEKMNALCVLSGHGIRPGHKLPQAKNIDIAPTIAQLLGLKDFAADGKVLSDALQP